MKQSNLKHKIEGLLTRDLGIEPVLKSVTVRVDLNDYAWLKVLASHLDGSVAGTARLILEEGIRDACEVLRETFQDNEALTKQFIEEHQALDKEESLNKAQEYVEEFKLKGVKS